MDTTDPDIVFDENGVCNHCHNQERMIREYVIEGEAAYAISSRFRIKSG